MAEWIRDQARDVLADAQRGEAPDLESSLERLREVLSLMDRVLDQTRRRAIGGESVPAGE